MPSKYTKQELEAAFQEHKTIVKTAKALGCNYGTVKAGLIKYQIPFELEKKRVEISEEDLKRVYLEKQSVRDVAEHFGCSHETIRELLHKYDACNAPIRYKCNEDFFSKDSEEVFYVAGFIAADGNIKDQRATDILDISLSKNDKSHIEKIKKLLQAENPIHDYLVKNSKRNSKWNDTWKSEMKITSQKLSDDLKRFNVEPRKSLILTFPEWLVKHPMVNHFMRGYFDGDGSFHTQLQKGRKTEQLYFGTRGTSEFLTVFRTILERECKLNPRDTEIRISSGCGMLEYGGNGVLKKISDFLYKDATIWLDRKYEFVMALNAKKEESK